MPSVILGTVKVTHADQLSVEWLPQSSYRTIWTQTPQRSIFIFRCSDGQFNVSFFVSSIDPSRSVFSRNVTIWLTRSTFKIKAVIQIQGQSYHNWDYLRFGCVAMVTLKDRCSLRCNLGVLFYTRVLSAF